MHYIPVHRASFLLVPVSFLVAPACGAYDNFPVKSVNMNAAQSIAFYKSHTAYQISLEDAHPVYGFEASDGGFVFCGKGMESETSSNFEAFAVKFSASGDYAWGWKSNVVGMDAANACLQLPSNGDIIVVGHRLVGGVIKRSITKLSLTTGAEAWTSTDFGDSTGSHGAWEGIELCAAGTFAYVGGYTGKPDTSEMSFRSYGNSGGTAALIKLPVSALTASTPPTSASATWSRAWSTRMSAKAVRPLPNGEVAVMFFTDGDAAGATSVAKLSAASGTAMWGPIDFGSTHGEGTDIQVSSSAIFMTGHHDCDTSAGGASGLCGKLTKIRASDGSMAWTKAYSSCGIPNACGSYVIKNECWGLTLEADGGTVISCGTGIENCNGMSGGMLTSCQANQPLTADARAGAVARAASVWQSFVIRTDADGNLLWQRTDQYREPSSPALGQSGWEAVSSASEYVAKCADGGLIFVNDEGAGIGVMKLNAPGSTTGGSTTGTGTADFSSGDLSGASGGGTGSSSSSTSTGSSSSSSTGTSGSSTLSPPSPPEGEDGGAGLGTGAIIGIAAGGVVLVVAAVGIVAKVLLAKGGAAVAGSSAASASSAAASASSAAA